jgi:hypothetical protein
VKFMGVPYGKKNSSDHLTKAQSLQVWNMFIACSCWVKVEAACHDVGSLVEPLSASPQK